MLLYLLNLSLLLLIKSFFFFFLLAVHLIARSFTIVKSLVFKSKQEIAFN